MLQRPKLTYWSKCDYISLLSREIYLKKIEQIMLFAYYIILTNLILFFWKFFIHNSIYQEQLFYCGPISYYGPVYERSWMYTSWGCLHAILFCCFSYVYVCIAEMCKTLDLCITFNLQYILRKLSLCLSILVKQLPREMIS